MRRRIAALSVVPLLLLGATACGEETEPGSTASGEEIPGLEVSGDFGKAPEVTLEEPLTNTETVSEVIIEGDGAEVEEGHTASLHIQVLSGKDGEMKIGTYEQGAPLTGVMSAGQIFPAVLDSVVGLQVGSRVAISATPEEAFGETGAEQYGLSPDDNVVFVVDVMSVPLDGPEGEEAEVPSDAPTIQENAQGEVTGFTFENAPKKPSAELQVIPVIEGEGDAIESGDAVTFDYLGQIYGTKTVFDESFSGSPTTFQVGVGSLIKGWDEGLIGVKAGSRVIIVAPPEYGYGKAGNPQAKIKGTDTLVFVVDVLGVS